MIFEERRTPSWSARILDLRHHAAKYAFAAAIRSPATIVFTRSGLTLSVAVAVDTRCLENLRDCEIAVLANAAGFAISAIGCLGLDTVALWGHQMK